MPAHPIASSRPTGDGSVVPRDRFFLFASLITLGILAYAWMLALSKTANDFNLDPSYISLFQTLVGVVNIAALCFAFSAKPRGIAVALALFVGQFIVYMIMIAFVYPYECSFTEYTRGNEYSGSEISLSDPGDLIEKKKIAVECSVKICLFPGFCTDGGREFFTCLAHALPLVFAFGFHSALQHVVHTNAAVNSVILALNMVDIQDFWVLFLDDGIIKNYWGRDNCDEYGCTGKKSNTWRLILLFFVTSSLTTLYMLVDSVFVAVSGKQQRSSSYVFWAAIANLCCLEIPFFVLRVWCSLKFDIVASTLLVKNALGMMFNFVRCRYGDDVTKFAEQYPQSAAFLTSSLDSLYDVQPDSPSEESFLIDIQDNNNGNNDTGSAATSSEPYPCGNIVVAVSSLAVIVCAWLFVLTKTVNEFKLKHDAIEVIWLAAIAVNCLAFYLFWKKRNVTVGLSLFVIQFPVYMTAIAFTYPNECAFTVYEEGTQYTGNGVVDMDSASAGTRSDDKEIQVDCDVKICFPLTDFCTDGGRELFTCLAHATPLVFALGFKSALKDSLQRTAPSAVFFSSLILLNMVDIQDFWVLFLEDDIIKNYWGRDNCESGWIFATYQCSGHSFWTWRLLMACFWTSILATLFLLVNCVLIALKIKAPWGHRLLKIQALSIMLCHELPFFVLRIWCSMTFDIVASTLVVKNLVGISLLGVICWYDGKLKDAIDCAHPFLGQFLIKMAGAVYTDESVDEGDIGLAGKPDPSTLPLRNETDEEPDDNDNDNPNHHFRNRAAGE